MSDQSPQVEENILYAEPLRHSPDGELLMPAWMDCTWRRMPCSEADCPLCGRVMRDRRREARLEDISLSINAAMVMVRSSEGENASSSAYGGERPKMDAFPQGARTVKWGRQIVQIGRAALEAREPWLLTAAAADLFWYVDMLAVKVARQLANRWELDQGDRSILADYHYTRRVIAECVATLIASLEQLALVDCQQKGELILALMEAQRLKDVVVAI